MKYGKAYGGADPELIEGDIFRMIVKVPEFGTRSGPCRDQIAGEATGEVLKLLVVMRGEMKRSVIQEQLGLKHEDHFRVAYLLPAMKDGVIEMTIPDKPTSSKQRYRLTEKGKKILEDMA